MGASLGAPSRRRLAAVWLAVAASFGALMIVVRATESSLDDPDAARQRPGFLDAGSLPQPAPSLTASLPRRGHRAVVFFVRPQYFGPLCRSLAAGDLASRADLAIVVGGSGQCNETEIIDDPTGRFARLYGLREPRSGGAPVGYAIVDREGYIRYRTLDPTVADELREVETILRATP